MKRPASAGVNSRSKRTVNNQSIQYKRNEYIKPHLAGHDDYKYSQTQNMTTNEDYDSTNLNI